jgi:hypothetical protein
MRFSPEQNNKVRLSAKVIADKAAEIELTPDHWTQNEYNNFIDIIERHLKSIKNEVQTILS